jgi:aminotransferase
MTRVANSVGAINLSQGFPDFDPPPGLMRAGGRAGRHGPHQYAITWGAPAFREALARTQARFMGIPIDPDRHVVVTCGATEAMMAAMMTVCDPGDEVIIFSPFYENYGADAILTGATPVYVPLRPPDFAFDDRSSAARSSAAPRPWRSAILPTRRAKCSAARSWS